MLYSFIIVGIIIVLILITIKKENFTISNLFSGKDKCLDIINDGTNNKLIMSQCGNYSGQQWYNAKGNLKSSYKLQNTFSGKDKCLDIINDGANNKLIMSQCGNYSGQQWYNK